jgi:hypothetical protein
LEADGKGSGRNGHARWLSADLMSNGSAMEVKQTRNYYLGLNLLLVVVFVFFLEYSVWIVHSVMFVSDKSSYDLRNRKVQQMVDS